MAYPACGYACVLQNNAANEFGAPCYGNGACTCKDAAWLNGGYQCIRNCDTADYNAWFSIASSQCALFGVALTYYPQTIASTSIAAAVPTQTLVTTEVVHVSTTQVSVVTSAAVTGAISALSGSASFLSIASASNTGSSTISTIAASTTAESVSGTQSSNSGLSTGTIAGIAMGAVALLLLAAFLGFLFWRQNRKSRKSEQSPSTEDPDTRIAPFFGGEYPEKDSNVVIEMKVNPHPSKIANWMPIVQDRAEITRCELMGEQPTKTASDGLERQGPTDRPLQPQMAEADSSIMSHNIISFAELADPLQLPELQSTSI